MRKHQLISMLIALLLVLSGCVGTHEETGTSTAPTEVQSVTQKLQFSVVPSENPGFTLISQEELGGATEAYLAYADLSEVSILMDGKFTPLPETIREGGITVPELFAFARMDSKNGFCQETYESEHGLTHFTYTYPECQLLLAYDVYETPSGRQELIEEIYILASTDHERNASHFYVDNGSEWRYFVDREDWGLDFTVSEVTPTQITLDVTQKGGQQIGELVMDGYSLYRQDETPDGNPGFIGQSMADDEGLPIAILMNGSGQITVDWSAAVGALDAGDYYIKLSIADLYDQEQVHPLMENYYDKQSYNIAFSIA